MKLLTLFAFRSTGALLVALALAACGGSNESIVAPASAAAFRVVLPSLALAGAPTVTASADGSTWLAWAEGDSAHQSLISAQLDGAGGVSRVTTVQGSVPAALRDQRIVMEGTTAVVVWREYDQPDDVKLNAASFANGTWHMEVAEPASAAWDVAVTPLPGGGIAVGWTRVDSLGRFQLVAARRSAGGEWSAPAVIRSGANGMTLLRSGLGVDEHGALMALWTESADNSQTTVPLAQTLYSSQSTDGAVTWSGPLVVDTGQLYDSPALASFASGQWVVAWMTGAPTARTAIVSKRFDAGVWSATVERIDAGQDDQLLRMSLASANHRVFAAWTGQAADARSASLRAATLDAWANPWPVPTLIHAQQEGYPNDLRLGVEASGVAGVVCDISQGAGPSPFLITTDSTGHWRPGAQLDLDAAGLGPDLSFFSPSDVVTAWLNLLPGGRYDIVVRRVR